MRKSLSRIFILTKRNIKEIVRDPLSLSFMLAMPLFMEILFYLIFHKMTTQFEMKYLAPGIVAFSQAFLCLFAGILISTDRNTTFLTRLYVSKARSYEFIFGYALALLPLSLLQAVLFLLVGGIIDSSIFSVGMIFTILLSFVTSLLFIGLGILFGSLCNEKSVGGISSIAIVGQSVLSGMWFPIDGMSGGMVTFMKCLPFKNATDLLQNTLIGAPVTFGSFYLPLIVLLAYATVVFLCAIIVFSRKMKEN